MSQNLEPVRPHIHAVGGLREGEVVLHERYRLVRPLGRGGMGAVWLAEDAELRDEHRALKFIPDLIIDDPEELEILKQEAAQSQKLTHKNIVRVYDFVRDKIHAAIAMEFIDGPTLKQARAARPQRFFEVEDIRGWVGQLLDALHYAHSEAGVVHHDLKPANIMLTQSGQLKVTDFGISQAIGATISRVSRLASGTGMGGTDSLATGGGGTPAFMSPQQVMGGAVAATDDIYSLGATLHELLTGRPPFFRGEILTQLLHKEAPGIDQARAELGRIGEVVPAAWQETIRACLEKSPAKRPQSVAEVGKALGYANFQAVQAGREGPTASSRSQKYAAIRDEAELPDPFEDDESPGGGKRAMAIGLVALGLLVAAGFGIKALFVPLGADVSPENKLPARGGDEAPVEAPPDPIALAMERAEDARGSGRYDEAIASYSEVLAGEPENAEARIGRAEAAVLAGHYQTTIDDVNYLEASSPGALEGAAYRLRAVAYQELMNPEAAIDDYSRAIERLPELAEGEALSPEEVRWRSSLFEQRGGLYLYLDRSEEAISDFETAVGLDPQNAFAYLDLAEARIRVRQFRDAKLDATEAIALDPTAADAYLYRGTANFFLGLYNEALPDFDQALAIDPDYAEAAQLKRDTEIAMRRRSRPTKVEDDRNFLEKLRDGIFRGRRR